MTESEARELLDTLGEHYGEPVKPISEYCNAIEDWLFRALASHNDLADDQRDQSLDLIWNNAGVFWTQIKKSNYLWRRIYAGQPHATERCPVHKGEWSGCTWKTEPCGCDFGGNVTGWIWDHTTVGTDLEPTA